ncbi:hypothetical protein DFJ73DRAFT_964701 [Zopfochytrium polystomum]|nr:hypothetical protein DFJ73DRAFT_964701 [Zopfochytrium polystomum]
MDSATIAVPICSYLPGRDRFVVATLLRLPSVQALALYSIESAGIAPATSRGDIGLLRFRLEYATAKLGSVWPPQTLCWTLKRVETIEYWATHGVELGVMKASETGLVDVLQFWKDFGGGVIDMKNVANICVDVAVRDGCVETLEWWRTSGFPVDWTRGHRTRSASMAGRLNVLEWWKQHALPLGPPKIPIQYAADSGSVPVLEFWRGSVPDFAALCNYTPAVQKGHIEVLEWFRESGFPISSNSPEIATHADQATVLEWLLHCGLPMNWDKDCVTTALNATCLGGRDKAARWFHAHQELKVRGNPISIPAACGNGAIGALEFLLDTGLESKWHDEYLVHAAAGGHLNVFEWRLDRIREPLVSVDEALTLRASSHGRVEVLQWLKDHGVTVPCTQDAIHAACKNTAVLQWFKENATAFSFNSETVIAESIGDLDVLQWWKQSGLNVEWPSSVSMYAICWKATNHASVLQWWRDNGATFYRVAPATAYLIERQNIPALEWVRASGQTITTPAQVQHLGQYLRWWREDQERDS